MLALEGGLVHRTLALPVLRRLVPPRDRRASAGAVSLRHPLVREAVLSAAAAALVAAALAWLGPPGTDFAAHAYQRTLFLEHGFTLWNNFWYAGRYSFVTYSLLYYPLAALLGIRLLAVATIALAALAFAVVLWREWGPTTRWSSRTLRGRLGRASCSPPRSRSRSGWRSRCSRSGRCRPGSAGAFAALAALTLAASPLAFLLLVDRARRRRARAARALGATGCRSPASSLAGAVEVVLWRLFPGGGRFPFSVRGVRRRCRVLRRRARVDVARRACARAALRLRACISRRRDARIIVPSAIGENVGRLRFAAIPLVVLVFSLRELAAARARRSRRCCSRSPWNVTPLAWSYVHGTAPT